MKGRRIKKGIGRIGEGLISHYSMLIQWSDLDQVYIVSLPEFGGCKTHGETYGEAVKNGVEVLDLLMESCQDDGDPLPEPAKFPDYLPQE